MNNLISQAVLSTMVKFYLEKTAELLVKAQTIEGTLKLGCSIEQASLSKYYEPTVVQEAVNKVGDLAEVISDQIVPSLASEPGVASVKLTAKGNLAQVQVNYILAKPTTVNLHLASVDDTDKELWCGFAGEVGKEMPFQSYIMMITTK